METEEDEKKYFSRPDIKEALNIAKDLAVIKKKTDLKSFEYNFLKPSLKLFIANKKFYPLNAEIKSYSNELCLIRNKSEEFEKI